MTVVVQEGALQLTVASERVLKWDDHRAFSDGLKRRAGTKAVDVCAVVDGVGPIYLELKDFRASAIENADRTRSGALAQEVAEKVRDTLAGLVWACGRGIGESYHETLVGSFLRPGDGAKPIVVLWLEEDTADPGGASALQDAIRKALRPHILAKVIVTSTHLEARSSAPLQWLHATGLPSAHVARRGARKSRPRTR
ncbi:MAG: hypothetical protein H6726_23145 [Sandaracinaceae bacterium]|nr:hypothetical protein [Sandaracinaceae bacterium]